MRIVLFRGHPAEGWPSMDRYATELHAALSAGAPPAWHVAMPMPPDPGSRVYPRIARRMLLHPRWARARQGDVNHVLDHSHGHLLLALDPDRTVVSVHDLAPLHFPGRRLGVSRAAWRRALRGLARARHVICPSTFVASELRLHLAPLRAEVHCIPHAVGATFRPPSREEAADVRRRYGATGCRLLLHVGRTHARKNFGALLDSVAGLLRAGEPVVLVQAGGRPDAEARRRLRAQGLEGHVRFAGSVPEHALAALYGAADVFVFPSLYEGFGLPVLEAMACGTPVVAADAASLPEVVGEAGLLAPPDDPGATVAAVRRVLTEPGLAEALRSRGLERARRFSWRSTADRTLRVYERCRTEAEPPTPASRAARP